MSETINSFEQLLKIEDFSNDTIVLKRAYVDITKDLIAGLILAVLVYWASPSKKDNKPRMRAPKDGKLWLAKNRDEWWDECRITPKQYDRGVKILITKGLVEAKNSLFRGKRTPLIRIVEHELVTQLNLILTKRREGFESSKSVGRSSPKVNTDVPERVTPITETYTENLTNKKREKYKREKKIPVESYDSPCTHSKETNWTSKTDTQLRREAKEFYPRDGEQPDRTNSLYCSWQVFEKFYQIYPERRKGSRLRGWVAWHVSIGASSKEEVESKMGLFQHIWEHIHDSMRSRDWREGFVLSFVSYFRGRYWEAPTDVISD